MGQQKWQARTRETYLESLFVVLDIVTIDIVMRPNGLFKLRTNNHTWTFSGRTTSEEHDTATGILERSLQEADCHIQRDSCAAKRTPVVCDGPWIALELLKDIGDLELALLNREEESLRSTHRLWWSGAPRLRLLWLSCAGGDGKSKHLLHLFACVISAPPEDV